MIDKSLVKVLGLALSFPSVIIVTAYSTMELVKHKAISKTLGLVIFIAVLFNVLFMMVYYVFQKKNKSK